jgi:hypothetical protein
MDPIIPKEKEEAIKADLATLQNEAKNIVIKTDDDMQNASAFLAQVKGRINRLKEIKDELVKPFQSAVRNANTWFKDQTEPFITLETQVKSGIGAYVQEKAKQAAAEAKKNQAPVEKPKTAVNTEHGRVSTSQVWTYDIVDEAKIPKKYLCVDRGAINLAIKSGERKIPGVKIYQKTSVRVLT